VCVCVRVCGYSYVTRGYVSRSRRESTRRRNSVTSHPTRSPSS
jgi:hypothetical protein